MAQPLRQILEQHRDQVLEAALDHHAHNVRVFGSAGRGEEGPNSDIDLLVDFELGASLLRDHAGLTVVLEDLLGVSVDVVDAKMLRDEIRDVVLAEAAPL